MNILNRFNRPALAAAFAVSFAAAAPSSAIAGVGLVTLADFHGPWTATLNGLTGCGHTAMHVAFTMNSTGTGTGTLTSHGQCGNSVLTGQTFRILSLSTTGNGTANLTCGPGCGWNLRFTMSPDRQVMNLIDVDPANPGNFIGGVAVHY